MNDGYTYRERIGPRAAGKRLDHYLGERYAHATLDDWRRHIAAGRVLLDGAPAQQDDTVEVGQQLEWRRPPWREAPAPLHLELLYADADVIVVDKPAGLATMPGGGFLQHTLVYQLRLLDETASPTHRLGRWTSGAVLCSRNATAGARLAAQFAARSITKRYRALASGTPNRDVFDIDVPIGPVPYPPLGTLHAACGDGRPAWSQVTVVERREQSFLCDVAISTGRPHQIRIHLAAAGHPLLGDPLYALGGLPAPGSQSLPGDRGYCLHAAEIGFDHPTTGQRIVVGAPPPRALRPEP